MQSRFDLKNPPDIQSIELWAQSIIAPSEPLSIHNLSAFGLKTPLDVVAYLKSPEGTALKAAIAQKLANEATNQEKQRMNADAQLKQKQGLLFLALLTEKASAEKNEHRKQLNTSVLHVKKDSLATTPAALQDAINHYNQLINAAETEERLLKLAIKNLETKIAELSESKIDISKKYKTYESHINRFYELLTKGNISLIKDTLESKLNDLADRVSEAIKNNKVNEARELMHEYNALILQGAMLNEVKTTSNNNYFDAEGKPSNSYEDAHFVTKGEERVVKHEGQYYLLKPGQDLSNPETKKEALQKFAVNKRNIMGIKVLIKHYQAVETEMHDQRVSEIGKMSEQLSEKKTKLEAIKFQIATIKDALTHAEALKNSPRSNLKAPFPNAQLRPENCPETRIIAEKFRKMTPVTYQIFMDTLRNRSPQIQSFFYSNIGLTEAQMRNNPTSQIADWKMAAFLKNIALLGRDPTNPAVTTIVNDYDRKNMSQDQGQGQNQKPPQSPKIKPQETQSTEEQHQEDTLKKPFNPSPFNDTNGLS